MGQQQKSDRRSNSIFRGTLETVIVFSLGFLILANVVDLSGFCGGQSCISTERLPLFLAIGALALLAWIVLSASSAHPIIPVTALIVVGLVAVFSLNGPVTNSIENKNGDPTGRSTATASPTGEDIRKAIEIQPDNVIGYTSQVPLTDGEVTIVFRVERRTRLQIDVFDPDTNDASSTQVDPIISLFRRTLTSRNGIEIASDDDGGAMRYGARIQMPLDSGTYILKIRDLNFSGQQQTISLFLEISEYSFVGMAQISLSVEGAIQPSGESVFSFSGSPLDDQNAYFLSLGERDEDVCLRVDVQPNSETSDTILGIFSESFDLIHGEDDNWLGRGERASVRIEPGHKSVIIRVGAYTEGDTYKLSMQLRKLPESGNCLDYIDSLTAKQEEGNAGTPSDASEGSSADEFRRAEELNSNDE